MSVEVGSEAPDFTLRDETGQEVTLSDLRGRNVVLVFYPFAFSGICTKELHDVTGFRDSFEGAGAEVLGISVDSPFALKAFKQSEGISARLLADFEPKGEVARSYGVYLDAVGAAARGTFVVDKDGKIAYKVVNLLGDARDQNEVVEALASCPV
jgi:mycoredoxin-dependent peroxiredoxin